jgi:hypothetical protein
MIDDLRENLTEGQGYFVQGEARRGTVTLIEKLVPAARQESWHLVKVRLESLGQSDVR